MVRAGALNTDDVAPPDPGAGNTAAAAALSPDDCDRPSSNKVDAGGGLENLEPRSGRGHPAPFSETSDVGLHSSGSNNSRDDLTSGGSDSSGVSSGVSSSSSSSSSSSRRWQEESVIFAVLEASIHSGHGWLCEKAFREMSVMMGNGDGKGLPPPPRKLTAVLTLLQRFMSLLWVAGSGQMEEDGRGEIGDS